MCEQFDYSELNIISFIIARYIEDKLKSIKILERNGFPVDSEAYLLEQDRALLEKVNQLKIAAFLEPQA